jgi:Zn ribbon nucleic-acid-binding protein
MTMYPVTLHASFPRERTGHKLGAPLPCPACGHTFIAEWVEVKVDEQTCPACGHSFPAMWPGFNFAPVDADGRPVPPFNCQHCGHQYHGPHRSPVWPRDRQR